MGYESYPPMTMPVQPAGNNYGGDILGQNWIWIIVLFLFGWGRNGNQNGGGVADGYALASDFANLERKLDGINNGICDSTFALNNSIKDGFSAAEMARANAQMQFMQQFFALQQQLSQCCCENREAIAQVRYDMATQDCQTRNLIQSTARDIIDAMNCGLRGRRRMQRYHSAVHGTVQVKKGQCGSGFRTAFALLKGFVVLTEIDLNECARTEPLDDCRVSDLAIVPIGNVVDCVADDFAEIVEVRLLSRL